MDKRIVLALAENPHLKLIENDTYNIAERIKEIDKSYFIVFNARRKQLEVHSYFNVGSTYCFVVPFPCLDARTLVYARQTRVDRDVVETIESENKKREKSLERTKRSLMRDMAVESADRMWHASGGGRHTVSLS